jgi:hypothetical protein
MDKNEFKKLEGKMALVTGAPRATLAQQSPSVSADGANVAITYAKDETFEGSGALLRIPLREDHFPIRIQGEQNESPL